MPDPTFPLQKLILVVQPTLCLNDLCFIIALKLRSGLKNTKTLYVRLILHL